MPGGSDCSMRRTPRATTRNWESMMKMSVPGSADATSVTGVRSEGDIDDPPFAEQLQHLARPVDLDLVHACRHVPFPQLRRRLAPVHGLVTAIEKIGHVAD